MTSAGARRARNTALTLILLLAVTASVGLANYLAAMLDVRVDVTATKDHDLAPRTRAILDAATTPSEIVVVGDLRRLDHRARQRTDDVLQAMTAASDRLRATWIDASTTSGAEVRERLVHRLIERERADMERHRQAVDLGLADTRDLAAWLAGPLAQDLQALAAALAPIQANRSAQDRVLVRAQSVASAGAQLSASAQSAADVLAKGRIAGVDFPDTSNAAAQLGAQLTPMTAALDALAREMAAYAQAEAFPAAARDMADRLAQALGDRRDRTARAADALLALEPLDVHRIAATIESQLAVLVIPDEVGPNTGLASVDPETLFPPTAVLDAAAGVHADLRRRAEELFATALLTVRRAGRPLVVLVHGEARPFARDPRIFGAAVQRLGLRGIDLVEWPAALEESLPSLSAYGVDRPVVYVCHATDSASAGPDASLAGPVRAARLAAALRTIVDSGRPLLLSIAPSTLPSAGQPDPTVQVLADFGLVSDSARPLLRPFTTEGHQGVSPEHAVRARETGHPLAGAILGLPTLLTWATPIGVTDPPPGVTTRVAPILRVTDSNAWAESQWLGLARTPMDQWSLLPTPPRFDEGRDDATGDWAVVVAAERTAPGLGGPQRLVVVGANAWFTNQVAQAQNIIDGRLAPAFPGNMELLEAAVYWLAGEDLFIGQSATARAVPLVAEIPPKRLALLRWALVGGLPVLVLLLGVLWRIITG